MLGSQKGCPFLFPASAKGQGSGHVFLKVVHRRGKESSAERNTARKNPNKKAPFSAQTNTNEMTLELPHLSPTVKQGSSLFDFSI